MSDKKAIRIVDPEGRSEKTFFEKREDMLNILYRLQGQLGAIFFLMGGSANSLAPPYNDLEMWMLDLRERVDNAIEIATEIGG